MDDLSSGRRANVNPEARLVDLDISAPEFLDAAVSFRPEVISHWAAQATVPGSVSDPQRDALVNVVGGINVCRAAVAAGCSQLVYVNTGGALYGEPEYLPCDEDHPDSPYQPLRVEQVDAGAVPAHTAAWFHGRKGPAPGQRLRPAAGPQWRVGGRRHLCIGDGARRAGGRIRRWRAYTGLRVHRRRRGRPRSGPEVGRVADGEYRQRRGDLGQPALPRYGWTSSATRWRPNGAPSGREMCVGSAWTRRGRATRWAGARPPRWPRACARRARPSAPPPAPAVDRNAALLEHGVHELVELAKARIAVGLSLPVSDVDVVNPVPVQ